MSEERPRNGAVAKTVAICGLGLGALAFFVLATSISDAVSTSEETEQVFNDAAELPNGMIDAVTWLPDAEGVGRQMDPLSRHQIARAWLRAWAQLALVAETGEVRDLDVSFSSSALEGLRASGQAMADSPVHQLGHDLRLTFYSEDGQAVTLTAPRTRLLRGVETGHGARAWYDTVESYDAVLLLEDGVWKVQHWIRTEVKGAWSTEQVAEAGRPRPPGSPHGINYYARSTPWSSFWASYDPSVIEADLDRIEALDLDSVRVFVPFAEMNGPEVSAGDLAPVVHFLDNARLRGIGVIVTLFDGRTDHRPARWDSDEGHLEGVVSVLVGHPAIMAWDLKNEPDRDVGIHRLTEGLLHAWLGHMTRHLRSLDSATPITVGWSTADAAGRAPVHGDILSFHHYGPADELPTIVEQLRVTAGDRPIWLTEYGLPTWNTILPNGHTEVEQAAYYADILEVTDGLEIEGRLAWTLWDLATAPPDAGILPWKTGPQTSLGVLRADGSEKPAAALLRSDVDLTAVQRPGLFTVTVGKPFRLMLVGLVLFALTARGFSLKLKRLRSD